ncbi:MAG: glycosyltransferase family 2 protein, partial [Lachnospiraceae bacterium]|nr:glycosyltransferase family 2 protein [Lachnospiraceae bacterium]
MKKISITTSCYNEEENIPELCQRIKEVFSNLNYDYEVLIANNGSTDGTLGVLEQMAAEDKRIKVIVNSRNFGPMRSGYSAFLQADGDAAILMASDLQDPPEMIPEFIKKWEEGYKIVLAQKTKSKENKLVYAFRKLYYKISNKISETEMLENVTGFGLYDKHIVDILRSLNEPNPFMKSILGEIGFEKAIIEFTQPKRIHGKSSYSLYQYYDLVMLGVVNNSKMPLRVATIAGFFIGFLSFLIALVYLVLKLVFWDTFDLGMAPVLIGIFGFAGLQLFFLGLI